MAIVIRKSGLVLGIFALVVVLALSSYSVQGWMTWERERIPEYGEVPPFELFNTNGLPISLEAMKGKVWVADFIFTTCAGPCPQMTTKMAELHRVYESDPRVNFVSISVDPEYDTPEVLTRYAEGVEADLERWHFLTGPLEAIHQLAVEGFKLGSVDEPLFHSTRFVLIDELGRIRGYYTGTEDESVLRLSRDIATLLSDPS